jgi:hypothetical protein
VGIDWATEEHQVALVDPEGNQPKELKVKHDGEVLDRFVTELLARVDEDVSRSLHDAAEAPNRRGD